MNNKGYSYIDEGPSCGQVVSMLAFYCDNRGSNPVEVYSFC